MIKLGQYNTLRITRFTDHGAYLDGGTVGEILMPKTYVERSMRPGDEVEVFVYLDQSERLVGTLETPLARVGDFAFLKVAWVNEYGAFLDWGLMKDLFVPSASKRCPCSKAAAIWCTCTSTPKPSALWLRPRWSATCSPQGLPTTTADRK